MLAMDARIDVEQRPKSAPDTEISDEPVDGKFLDVLDEIAGRRRSST